MFKFLKMTKKIYPIIAGTLAMAGAVVGYGYQENVKNQTRFIGDGYIMTYKEGQEGEEAVPVYFSAGTKYKVRYPEKLVFKDTSGQEQELDCDSFIHYADGSISPLTESVVIETGELQQGLVNYYSVNSSAIMQKQGDSWVLDNGGNPITFDNFIWKLSDYKYMLSSSELGIDLPDGAVVNADGFVEVNYIDDGIVQVLTQDQAWQVLSTGTEVAMADAMTLNVQEKKLMQGDTERLNLSAVALDDLTNIAIAATNLSNFKVPTFNIQTIDGIDGDLGEIGETGVSGENGEQGIEGEAGVEGDNGEKGKEGEAGEEGEEGQEGSEGVQGESGSRGSGGAGGSQGGLGGSNSADVTIYPSASIVDYTHTSNSVSGSLIINEESVTDNLTPIEYTFKLIDNSTNKIVETWPIESGQATTEFDYPGLSSKPNLVENREYRLMLTYQYSYEDASGSPKEGSRILLNRVFNTNTMGIEENYDYATDESIHINVTKGIDSTLSGFSVVIRGTGDNREYTRTQEVSFDDATSMPVVFNELDSNTSYTIELIANSVSVTTHEYKTLKKAPTITEAPIFAISPQGYFELSPQGIIDEQNSIVSYRYELCTERSTDTPVTSVEKTNSNTTAIYVDGVNVKRNVSYVARLVIEYFDNEKYVELASPFTTTLEMEDGMGVPYLQFTAFDKEYESLNGFLNFYPNGSKLDVSETHPLILTFYGEAFYDKVELVKFTSMSQIPLAGVQQEIHKSGLRAGITYRFDAYGYYEGEDTQRQLCTTIVKLENPDPLTATLTAEGGSDAINATLMFSRGDGGSADELQYEATTARTLMVTLYEGASTKVVGTHEISFAPIENVPDPAHSSTLGEYYGDVNDSGVNKLTITNTDFGKTANDLTADFYTVKIDSLTDYTSDETLRDKANDGTPVGEYVNYLEFSDESITSIVVEKKRTPPELPSPAINTSALTRADLENMGLQVDDENLSSTAIVGYVLQPLYDNTNSYARSINYNIYNSAEYDEILKHQSTNYDESLDPLEQLSDNGLLKPVMSYSTTVSSAQSTITPLIVLMRTKYPEPAEGDSTAEPLVYSGVVNQGTYKNTPFIYADRYSPYWDEDEEELTSANAPVLSRGTNYYFTYDLNLEMTEGDQTYRYPYQYRSGSEHVYEGVNNILKNELPELAPNMQPILQTYPYWITNDQIQWKIKAIDPDQTLRKNSFKVDVNNGAKIETVIFEDDSVKNMDDADVAFVDAIESGWLTGTIDTTVFGEAVRASDMNIVLNATYNSRNAYNNVNSDIHVLAETMDFSTARLPYSVDKPLPDTVSISYKQNGGLSLNQTIEEENKLTMYINSPGYSTYAGVQVMVYVNGKTPKTLYYPVGTKQSGVYTVEVPLGDLAEYRNDEMQIVTKMIYPVNGTGFGYKNIETNGFYTMMDELGQYYAYVKGILKVQDNPDNGALKITSEVTPVFEPNSNFTVNTFELSSETNSKLSLWLDNQGTGIHYNTKSVIFKPLTAGDFNNNSIEVSFSTMTPSIANEVFPAASLGLYEALLEFDLSENASDFIVGDTASEKELVFRVSKLDATGMVVQQTIDLPLKLGAILVEDSTTKIHYNLNFTSEPLSELNAENLADANKSPYRIEVLARLNGRDTVLTPLLARATGQANYINLQLLESVEIGTYRHGLYFSNNLYTEKILHGSFSLSSIVGFDLRYKLQKQDGPDNWVDVAVADPNPANSIHGDWFELPDTLVSSSSDSDDYNIVNIKIDPDRTNGAITYGDVCRVLITAVPPSGSVVAGTDVGEGTLSKVTIPSATPPMINLSMIPSTTDNGVYQMTCAYSNSDALKVLTSIGRREINNGSVTYYLRNSTDVTENSNVYGAVVIRIFENEKSQSGEDTDKWLPISTNQYMWPSLGEKLDKVVSGSQGFVLTNLKSDTNYKIKVYGIVDLNMEGKRAISIEDDIYTSADMSNYDTDKYKVGGLKDGAMAELLGEMTQRSLNETGFYTSKITMGQLNGSTVQMSMYNTLGITKVKKAQFSFVPVDNLDKAVSVVLEGEELASAYTQNSDGKVVMTIPVQFSITGDYDATVLLTGEADAGESIGLELKKETVNLNVTSAIASTALVAPETGNSPVITYAYFRKKEEYRG